MKKLITLSLIASLATSSYAFTFFETEPNNTRETANNFLNLESGDQIQGVFAPGATWVGDAQVPNDRDFFKINIAQNLPFGIYKHNIENLTVPHKWGMNSDMAQGFSNYTWYSFGRGADVQFKGNRDIDEPQNQPVPYALEYTRQQVAPRNLLNVSSGDITLTIPNANYSRLFNCKLFDSAGNHLAGAGGQFTSGTRNFNLANGTYFLVIGNALQAGSEIIQGYSMGNRTFRDLGGGLPPEASFASLTLTSGSLNQNIPFGQHVTPANPAVYKLTVVPEPATLSTVIIGFLLAVKKRRKTAQ